MESKKKRYTFFIKLFIALATIVAVVFCAYLAIDKLVVPKYFKDYGINNMHDLVAMVKTLYNTPDEKDIITNGYTQADQRSAVKKLISANFPSVSETELDYAEISQGLDKSSLVSGQYEFTDREIAGILDQMLDSGILASQLPNLKYLDTINISILELIITPTEFTDNEGNVYYDTDSANVSFTFKLDTSSVRTQMAHTMDIPTFFLDMIVPKTMYITINYNLIIDDYGVWQVGEGSIAVNGRTAKDSEILLNLLIEFIFPEEDQMTIDKFSIEFGNILIKGMDMLGQIRIKANVQASSNGVVLTI